MNQNKLKYWVAFHECPNIGSKRFKLLIDYFPSIKDAFFACYDELIKAGLSKNVIEGFFNYKKKININKSLEILKKENINIITFLDKKYSNNLKNIPDFPALLYYKGNINLINTKTISIVGTRKYSKYGFEVTKKITKICADNNITVVSGMAFGIDSISHIETIKNNGNTIAVLPSGLANEYIYPRTNYHTAKQILENDGLLISEYNPYEYGNKGSFAARNRLIAGLSKATLVVEAGKKSGALITANFALDYNREVCAIPGSIFSKSSIGTNNLIKSGANLISSPEDILEIFSINDIITHNKKKYTPKNSIEKNILQIISQTPTHIDEIIKISKLDTQTVMTALTILEIEDAVKDVGRGKYIIGNRG